MAPDEKTAEVIDALDSAVPAGVGELDTESVVRLFAAVTLACERVSDIAGPKGQNISWPGMAETDTESLARLGAALAADRASAIREHLATILTPTLAELDPVPHATVEQARRLASLKTKLLKTGAFTNRSLADGWNVTLAAARQRVRRLRERNEIFTVNHDGEALVPAAALNNAMQTRPTLQPVIATLREVGEDGWALWAWLVTPSAWLDGDVPIEVLDDAPARVLEAAQRRVSNAA